ncbi:MAG: BamA/TamA family outer membrane protein [candidate division WOR-3 bacterium]
MAVALAASVVLFLSQVARVDSIEAVRFAGNRTFSGRQLLSVVTVRARQPLDERRLDGDVRALEQFYHDNGFRDAQVGRRVSRGRRMYVVVLNVVEGIRTRVGTIAIIGNRTFETERLIQLLPVRVGGYYDAGSVSRCLQVVRTLYLNSGYPFANVTAEWRYGDTLADLVVEVTEGPRCYLGELRVRGNRTVRTATVLRTLELREGEMFSQQRLQEAARRLYATRLFQRVLFHVLRPDTSSNRVVVRFDVAEQPYRVFAFGGGFETPPWRLLFSIEWEHNNVLNRGQQFDVSIEFSPNFSGDFRTALDVHYRLPYLILMRVDLQTHPFFYWERVDTLLRREYGIETGLCRNLTRYLSLGLFNRLRLVADTSRGITNSVALNATYDSRDDFFDPASGLYVRPAVEVAGGSLGGDNDFYRFTAETRWFQVVGPRFVLAVRAMVGRDILFGRTVAIPYYEGFALGGRNTLRGYRDRSLGPDSIGTDRFGPAVLNTNVELRTPYVFGWVGLVVFFDAGEVIGSAAGYTLTDLEYSAGAGLRVRTPIGPVRLDWGKRLKNPAPGDKGKFYLGLLHAF